MTRRGRLRLRALAAILVVGVATVGLVATGAGAQTETTPGVTSKAVTLGFISSHTGVAAAIQANAEKACQARVDAQNAQGGVNGRKIDLETADDASSGANLTAAQDLVQNRQVFAVVNNSPFAFVSYRYLQGAGVPLIGGGSDGTYYGTKGNENIISALGNTAPVTGLTYDYGTNLAKKLGATKIGSVAYGIAQSSTTAAQGVQQYAAPASGLEPVYLNTSVDFATTDVGPIVLGLKNSGADAVYLPLVSNTDLLIAQGLQQNGVPMKAVLMEGGYGQATLNSPIAKTLNSSDIVSQIYKPVELKNDPAVKQFTSDLEKYAGITGVPDVGAYTGYIGCDLAITGLQRAGKNPTRQGFIDGLHNLGAYKPADLTCQPIDLSLKNFGKTPTTGCQYYLTFKHGKFVVMNNGKPYFGKLVGDPALIAANNTGTAADVTATSTP